MKKVLVIIDNLKGGGAEKVLVTFLKYADLSGMKVDLFLINKEGVYLKDVPSSVRLFYAFTDSSRFLNKVFRRIFLMFPFLFYVFFIRKSYNLEIAFREDTSTRILLKSPHREARKIAWLHTDLERYHYCKLTNREKYLRSLKQLDRLICVSEGCEAVLWRLVPEMIGKTQVVYNPVDTETIRRLSAEEADTGFLKEQCNLLTIGRLDEGKNHIFLIRCMQKLVRENEKIHLWILGDGVLRQRLETVVAGMGLQPYIHFLGFRKNPFPYLAACDVFVFSSLYEGLPTVIIEALILNKKIVSSYCGGAEEILQHGKCGLLSGFSEEEFCEKIKSALAGEGGAPKSLQKRIAAFGLEQQCRCFSDLLNEQLAS